MVFTNATAESQYKNRQCLFLIKKEDGEIGFRTKFILKKAKNCFASKRSNFYTDQLQSFGQILLNFFF